MKKPSKKVEIHFTLNEENFRRCQHLAVTPVRTAVTHVTPSNFKILEARRIKLGLTVDEMMNRIIKEQLNELAAESFGGRNPFEVAFSA